MSPIHLPSGRDLDTWQLAIWNADQAILSRPQKLQLMLMLEGQFNEFDPFRVVGDLLSHRALWDGVVMSRGFEQAQGPDKDHWFLHSDLITLRDISDGIWNVDTVFVLHKSAHTADLTRLANGWSADDVAALTESTLEHLLGCYGGVDHLAILRVWWD